MVRGCEGRRRHYLPARDLNHSGADASLSAVGDAVIRGIWILPHAVILTICVTSALRMRPDVMRYAHNFRQGKSRYRKAVRCSVSLTRSSSNPFPIVAGGLQ